VLPWASDLEALFLASDKAEGSTSKVVVSGDDLMIDVDPDLMCQVLINLLRNAADAAKAHNDKPAVSMTFRQPAAAASASMSRTMALGCPKRLRRTSSSPSSPPGQGNGRGPQPRTPDRPCPWRLDRADEGRTGGALFRIVL
jgi:hypothetical protein